MKHSYVQLSKPRKLENSDVVLFRGEWSDCSSEDWPFDVDTELTVLWEPLSSVCREVLSVAMVVCVQCDAEDIKWMRVCGGGEGDVQCALCDTGGVETRGGASKHTRSTVYPCQGCLHSTHITYPNTSRTTTSILTFVSGAPGRRPPTLSFASHHPERGRSARSEH